MPRVRIVCCDGKGGRSVNREEKSKSPLPPFYKGGTMRDMNGGRAISLRLRSEQYEDFRSQAGTSK